ncbi:MAG: sialidase family protein, partial [Thermoplasmata archaeon]|nr:sialidase family protein [Thermoplasmata archaeon]
MQKIFVWIVLGVLMGNVFIAISQTTEASEIKNETIDKSVSIDNLVVSEVNSPINRRLTLFEEDSISPVVICGDDDVLHMAWIDSRAMDLNSSIIFTSIFYKQSHDFGKPWTPDTELSTRITDATSIVLAVDGNYLAIAWEEGNDVFTLFSYDSGNSWAEPYQINAIESPSIALKGNDVYLVFKTRSQVGVPYLSGKKLTISPELQTPVVYDFNPAGNNQICSIADVTADDSSVHVVIIDQTNTQLHYYKSDDNCTTWSGGIIG